jgi:hypothetical protein
VGSSHLLTTHHHVHRLCLYLFEFYSFHTVWLHFLGIPFNSVKEDTVKNSSHAQFSFRLTSTHPWSVAWDNLPVNSQIPGRLVPI